ncbi:LysR substrate-binding domain-containing protein [Vibrio mangrovi]|uniref:HTH-type transcriptional regulator GltC n=1 Tax=Vibrio mangrovi TaxID=474394 RepID=A0A1Y6IYW1_9VIBR|nr:LysR substrate-binding domain-containing protein [Vibrio mangrovi]MDW6002657.1 LysR substrate-binding domain-containing protein [Vibrio mangrovi]SMS02816.1 HTH-type transcriptional regulator GltC [Vibrio mangrovi]
MANYQTLDLQALRTFVLGMELNNFALAAKRLHRSTSAVSAQLKKLEDQSGLTLVRKEGRHLFPTPAGEQLLSYARRLLALNDEAMQAIQAIDLAGQVRFAMQEDFAEGFLTRILGSFSRAHPLVQLSTTVARNSTLISGIREDQYDLALAWNGGAKTPYSETVAEIPLHWLGQPGFPVADILAQGKPLPLVMFAPPCQIRNNAIQALDAARIPWQVTYTSHSLHGIWAALEAGLGISARTALALPPSLTILNTLPPLPQLSVSLHQSREESPQPVKRLIEIIRQQLENIPAG